MDGRGKRTSEMLTSNFLDESHARPLTPPPPLMKASIFSKHSKKKYCPHSAPVPAKVKMASFRTGGRLTPNYSLQFKPSSACMRGKSAFGQDREHCLCVVVRPIMILGQISAILPVSRHSGSCRVTHSWRSIPMILSWAMAFGNIVGITFWAPTFYRYLRRSMGGTDFYTHVIAIQVHMISSMVLFLSGGVTAKYVAMAWPKLHDSVNELGLHNFRFLKYAVYIIPWFLLQEFCINAVLLLGEMCYDGFKMDPLTLQIRSSTLLANFMPNLSALTFAMFLLVASRNFREINEQLMEIQIRHYNRLQMSPTRVNYEDDATIVYKLVKLRILHESLCEAVRKLEDGFGLQMLAVFAATTVSFIVGVYSVVVGAQDIWAQSDDKLEFFIKLNAIGLMTIVSAVRILIIVLCAQHLSNNANEAGHILSGFNLVNASSEVKQQVRKFLDKLGMYGMKVTAYGIVELGSSFLGTATGNLITYVLVMMQFRLDDDPDARTGIDDMSVENATSLLDFMKYY